MKKFVVNKENKKLTPTQEQIKRQKDFSRIHHKYESLTKRRKKRLYRDPKLLILIFLIGLIAFLLFLEK